MNLTISPYKTDKGTWAFDHEHRNTVAEGLINGTELVLDTYYQILNKKDSRVGDWLKVTVSTDDYLIPDDNSNPAITRLFLLSSDEHGSVYEDDCSGKLVWLCPWLQDYFGEVPKLMYVTVGICDREPKALKS